MNKSQQKRLEILKFKRQLIQSGDKTVKDKKAVTIQATFDIGTLLFKSMLKVSYPALPTKAAGLYLARPLGNTKYWNIVHSASGGTVNPVMLNGKEASACIDRLIESGLDFTCEYEEVIKHYTTFREVFREILNVS